MRNRADQANWTIGHGRYGLSENTSPFFSLQTLYRISSQLKYATASVILLDEKKSSVGIVKIYQNQISRRGNTLLLPQFCGFGQLQMHQQDHFLA